MRRSGILAGLLAWALGSSILVGFLSTSEHRGRKIGELDFAYLYVAGYSWRAGYNPYDFESYLRVADEAIPGRDGRTGRSLINCSYAYAPTSAAMVMALAALRFDTARLTFLVINFIALAMISAFPRPDVD